jgi:hypothetical protein
MMADNPTILLAITPVLASSFPKLVLPRESTRHFCHRRCMSARCRRPIVLPSSSQSTVEPPCISLASAGNVILARVLFVANDAASGDDLVHKINSKKITSRILNHLESTYEGINDFINEFARLSTSFDQPSLTENTSVPNQTKFRVAMPAKLRQEAGTTVQEDTEMVWIQGVSDRLTRHCCHIA